MFSSHFNFKTQVSKIRNLCPIGFWLGHDLSDDLDYTFSFTQHPKEDKKGFESSMLGFIRIKGRAF